MKPIFFAWTRSFWLGIFPALLVSFDIASAVILDPEAVPPVAAFIAALIGSNAEQVETFLMQIAPVFALIVAHQRRGENRPYTVIPSRDALS